MNQPFIRAVRRGAAIVALTMTASIAHASDAGFPNRVISIVVPFSAGGGSDTVARILADGLSKQLGNPVIVENKTGASGNIGAEYVARARPDGHTLLFGSMGLMTVNRHLYKNMPFNPLKDFTAVARLYDTPHVIVANAKLPITSLQKLIDEAKARPGEISFGSAGAGTSTHLVGELFMHETQVKLLHVPYKGNGPALTDVVAGHIDVMFDQATNSVGHIKAGNLHALAVTSGTRVGNLPDVPTVVELKFPELETTSWTVLAAPAGTPAAVVQKLSEAIKATLADEKIQAKIVESGGVANFEGPDAANKLVEADDKRWGMLIKAAGIGVN